MAAPSNPPHLAPTQLTTTTTHLHQPPPSNSNSPIHFTPPLIAMVVVAAAAFLFITFSRLISRHLLPPLLPLFRRHRRRRHRRHRFHQPSDLNSPPQFYESSDGFYVYSPYGLDEAVIKTIPLTIYNHKIAVLEIDTDCAVCLVEFEDGDFVRTLPHCHHSFHVDCIDMWLRSHATCPLCRSGVYLTPPPLDSPLSPLMAARIRPSFDEGILLESMFLETLPEVENSGEIQEVSLSPEMQFDHHHRDFLLKRSYSFGFERSFPSERIVLGAATTPYRFRHHHRERRSFFWTPFSSLAKNRVFSFRRTMKSPAFFRRRGFFPGTESSSSLRWYGGGSGGGGGSTVGSSRRVVMKPLASPLFGRGGVFSSSRMRMGDPEALISPERYDRR